MEKKDVIILFYPVPWPGEERGRVPYALLYLERMIRDLGLKVIIIDEQVQKNYENLIFEFKDRILLAGISSMTGYQIKGGIRFSKKIKEISEAPVLWGGWHTTLLPKQTLEKRYIDMVLIGQGEIPFKELVTNLTNGKEITEIKGLGYKRNGNIFINPPSGFVDINEFPKVDYNLIDINNYVFKSVYSNRCIGYFSSHGCPFNCAFCCVSKVYNRRWYHKETEEVMNDLKYFKEVANIDSVTFDDDNFFVNKKFTLDLCNELMESNLNLLWDTSAHAGLFLKLFSGDEIKLLRKSGCRQIYVGAESGDQNALDLISKNTKVEDNYKFVKILKRHKITPMFSTMVCLPINPDRDFKATLNMIRKAKLNDLSLRTRIFFYTPYPGTELYEEARNKGFVPPKKLEQWASHTLRKFDAPWYKTDYRSKLEIFANFYLALVDPKFYKLVPRKLRSIVFIINKLFFPISYVRFKLNFFKYPLEAILFLRLLRLFNKTMKTRYCLGFESFID